MIEISAKRSSPRLAIAYSSDRGVWIRPESITTDGLRLASDPIMYVPVTAGCEEVGKVVLEALKLSEEDIPRPNLRKPLANHTSILQETGFKSFGTFAKRVKQVGISLDENTSKIEITPFEYIGKSTFQGKSDMAIFCRSDDASALGNTLKRAFEL
jgi:hypothetical protein